MLIQDWEKYYWSMRRCQCGNDYQLPVPLYYPREYCYECFILHNRLKIIIEDVKHKNHIYEKIQIRNMVNNYVYY